MSFPRYSEYKDSGVDWLGEVPAHWKVKPVKAVATCNDDVLEESTDADYEMEYVEISGVEAGRGINHSQSLTFANAPSRARRRVQDGDVIVSTVRTYLRAIAPVAHPPENMIVSTGFAVIRPTSITSGYLGYLFQAEFMIAEVIARSVGVSYPAINASELMRLHAALPPREEQAAITAFLDRETAKIDALVAEQEKLIALLKEKRQAVISHAVTKGLDPDVPMKDSGIEWLGEVPAHWGITPMRFIASVVRGASPRPAGDPRFFGGEAVPWVTVAEITKDDAIYLTGTESFLTDEGASHSNLFPSGTVIYSNSGATLGVPKIGRVLNFV
ncbi:MAG TPA: restriction endonuclease subunit S [Thiobacillaceae bacterium]|nr:restriction endonuclease subunit S [Thiobacillaceae bacterium]